MSGWPSTMVLVSTAAWTTWPMTTKHPPTSTMVCSVHSSATGECFTRGGVTFAERLSAVVRRLVSTPHKLCVGEHPFGQRGVTVTSGALVEYPTSRSARRELRRDERRTQKQPLKRPSDPHERERLQLGRPEPAGPSTTKRGPQPSGCRPLFVLQFSRRLMTRPFGRADRI
jgi:hypothetical protein